MNLVVETFFWFKVSISNLLLCVERNESRVKQSSWRDWDRLDRREESRRILYLITASYACCWIAVQVGECRQEWFISEGLDGQDVISCILTP